MAFERLPETTQTLYAELLEQVNHAEAEAAVLGAPYGTFVSKTIKGGTYWLQSARSFNCSPTRGCSGWAVSWSGRRRSSPMGTSMKAVRAALERLDPVLRERVEPILS